MKLSKEQHINIIEKASTQVGPGVFFSSLLIVVSFLPVFLLTGIEGRLFSPLAWTKTFILLVDAFLAITLTPVLISFLLKGKLKPEGSNIITRGLVRLYQPLLKIVLKWKWAVVIFYFLAIASAIPLAMQMGTEFMPPLDEGSILFMPVTMPDISNAETKRLLQVQDKIIKSMPEVESVLGKAGRASTATDNSPISMVETIIILKPRKEWRAGITKNDIINELNEKLKIPGVVNGWTQPIINRINMLSTGIRTDVGVKIYGKSLDSLDMLSNHIKKALENTDGVKDLYAEPLTGGKYLDISVKRDALARYNVTADDVNMLVESAIGGMPLGTVVEGRQRYAITARLAADYRNDIETIKRIPVQTPAGEAPLSALADIRFSEGPPMINSENAMLRGTVLFNVRGRDLGSTVSDAQKKLKDMVKTLPSGYYVEWSGDYENQIRAARTLEIIMPLVIIIILLVLYFTYKSFEEAVLSLITVPFALVGGVYMSYIYHINFSVAVAVGFIALFGMAIELAMLMTIYLNEAMQKLVTENGNSRETITDNLLNQYIIEGASKRLRPVLMTVSVSLFGLVPVLWATGTGSDVMRPITIPLIGGTITAIIYVLFITPAVLEIMKKRELKKLGKIEVTGLK